LLLCKETTEKKKKEEEGEEEGEEEEEEEEEEELQARLCFSLQNPSKGASFPASISPVFRSNVQLLFPATDFHRHGFAGNPSSSLCLGF
jgi:hypothetical protein